MAGGLAPLAAEEITRLVQVALGQAPAEVVLRGVRVVDVFRESVGLPTSLALTGERIASLGPEQPGWVGPETTVIEAGGLFCLPGLIDAHTHLDSIFQLAAYAPHALAGGNTTAVSETAMIAGAWGAAGVRHFLAEARAMPLRIFHTTPSLVPPFPDLETSAGLSSEEILRLLDDPLCVGVGETYWPAVIDGDPRVAPQFAAALARGKRLEGHAAGARGPRLTAYAAAGIGDCHEAITGEEALERLGLGLAVQVREGFVRREMAQVVPALRDLPRTSEVMLVSDLAPPEWILDEGPLLPLLRQAVELGVAPARAVAWLSLNPARYFGLEGLGAVAPGWGADLVLVEDLTSFRVRQVWLGGRQVADADGYQGPELSYQYPAQARETLRCPAPTPSDFHLPAPGPTARVRVVQVAGGTITKGSEAELAVKDGQVPPDPAQDVVKMAVIHRHAPDGGRALGFARGWGLRQGALATSLVWDTCNLFVLGTSEAEMARAAGRLKELGGGFVVVAGEQILAELPMPLAGVISELSLPEIHQAIGDIEGALHGLGCPLPRPFLTAQTFLFTGLPFWRLTDRGLVDVRSRQFLEVLL
ncbi:MAG: amidohydrolase family protein [Deltaproteobacteria bacterium]|nr:amidohydrolase family protein [Deltaproteobacteria bacterium]